MISKTMTELEIARERMIDSLMVGEKLFYRLYCGLYYPHIDVSVIGMKNPRFGAILNTGYLFSIEVKDFERHKFSVEDEMDALDILSLLDGSRFVSRDPVSFHTRNGDFSKRNK
jgi:hypothetical protein